jgi:hypothetical protein
VLNITVGCPKSRFYFNQWQVVIIKPAASSCRGYCIHTAQTWYFPFRFLFVLTLSHRSSWWSHYVSKTSWMLSNARSVVVRGYLLTEQTWSTRECPFDVVPRGWMIASSLFPSHWRAASFIQICDVNRLRNKKKAVLVTQYFPPFKKEKKFNMMRCKLNQSSQVWWEGLESIAKPTSRGLKNYSKIKTSDFVQSEIDFTQQMLSTNDVRGRIKNGGLLRHSLSQMTANACAREGHRK